MPAASRAASRPASSRAASHRSAAPACTLLPAHQRNYWQLIASGIPLSDPDRLQLAEMLGEHPAVIAAAADAADGFARLADNPFTIGFAERLAVRLARQDQLTDPASFADALEAAFADEDPPATSPARQAATPDAASGSTGAASGSTGAADGSTGAGAAADSSGRRTRAEQSRINGAKSRGPRTQEGKIAACMNAFRHGLRSRPGLLPDEDPARFQAFVDGVIAELAPDTPLQRRLARRAAELSWRLERIPLAERRLIERNLPDEPSAVDDRLLHEIGDQRDGPMLRLQRYASTIERSLRGCLRELRDLQAVQDARRPQPSSFVPAQPPSAGASDAVSRPPAVSRPEAPSDGLRISGSFGAVAAMAMPVTAVGQASPAPATTTPVVAPSAPGPSVVSQPPSPPSIATATRAAVSAISGSFGKAAQTPPKARISDWPADNTVAPTPQPVPFAGV